MQTKPAGWAALFSAPHRTEYEFTIGGTEYTSADIPSTPVISRAFADKLSIGVCCSGTLQLSVWAKASIPKAAAVVAYCRLSSPDGTTKTAWIEQGHYYVSSRSNKNGVTTLSCRDAMQKARTVYWDKTKITSWPAPMSDVVSDIADFMGVAVDSRTTIKTGSAYKVRVPDSDTTMLDVLSGIAAAHGGNWIITETGKLRLIPVASPGTVSQAIGGAHRGLTKLSVDKTITRVTLNCDDGSAYTAGTDAGTEITGDCLYASQEITDALGATCGSLRGVTNNSYSLSGAYLDPCVELGDTVSVADGELTRTLIVASANIRCNSSYNSDLAYQIGEDDEDEYPFIGATKKMENRIRGTLKKGEVDAAFTTYVNSKEGKANMTAALSGSFATAESLTEISQSITDVGSKISLSASYDDNSIGSNVKALLELVANPNSSEIRIKADMINFDGFTTFVRGSDLSESGKTFINGGNITTGTISADRIDVSQLKVSRIYSGSTSGKIAIDCTSGSTLYIGGSTSESANYGEIRLYSEKVTIGSWAWTNQLLIDTDNSRITSNDQTGAWEIGSSIYPFGKIYLGDHATGGSLTIESGKLVLNGTALTLGDTDTLKSGTNSVSLSSTTLTPAANDTYALGSSSRFWSDAYISSLKICYSTTKSVTLECSSDGKLTVGGTTFDPSASGSVSQLKSGTYSISLESSVLTPGANDTYALGSSSRFWSSIYSGDLVLCYSTTRSITLGCNSDGKLTVGGAVLDPSSAGAVSQLKSGTYTVSLSGTTLTPGSSNTYGLGSSSAFWSGAYVGSLYLCYSTSKRIELACNYSGNLTIGGTEFDPSGSSGSVSQLKSSYNTVTLSGTTLSPGSSGSYDFGSSSALWDCLYCKSIRIYYNGYKYVELACNYDQKLTSGGKVVTTA